MIGGSYTPQMREALERLGFDDPWPETTRFDNDAAYRAWLDCIAQNNRISCPLAPRIDDRVLVCYACSLAPGENDPNAYALFAVIES